MFKIAGMFLSISLLMIQEEYPVFLLRDEAIRLGDGPKAIVRKMYVCNVRRPYVF